MHFLRHPLLNRNTISNFIGKQCWKVWKDAFAAAEELKWCIPEKYHNTYLWRGDLLTTLCASRSYTFTGAQNTGASSLNRILFSEKFSRTQRRHVIILHVKFTQENRGSCASSSLKESIFGSMRWIETITRKREIRRTLNILKVIEIFRLKQYGKPEKENFL